MSRSFVENFLPDGDCVCFADILGCLCTANTFNILVCFLLVCLSVYLIISPSVFGIYITFDIEAIPYVTWDYVMILISSAYIHDQFKGDTCSL